jgi:hypothetical protein
MKRLLFIIGIVLCAAPAFAQGTTATYREDTPSATGENIIMVGFRRCNTPSSSSGTNGDRSTACLDANGALVIRAADSAGLIADESAHDAPYGSLAPIGVAGYASATPCTAVSGDGDKARVCLTRNGAAYVQRTDGTNLDLIDPCNSVAKTTDPISITADSVIIAAVSAKRNYICSLVLMAGAAEVVGVTEGTGSTCGTGQAALVGSTTDANSMPFGANGGFSGIGGSATIIAGKTANVDTCLKVSAGSVRVSGFVTWVQR